MKKFLVALAALLLPLSALAVQISVPSAPGAAYGLTSVSTGQYVASSTTPLIAGTNITFTGGTPYVFGPSVTISASGGSGTFPFTPFTGYNATTTALAFPGFISSASSTISYLGSGEVASNNGRLYNAATTTFNSPLNYAGGAVTLSTAGTWSGLAGTATALAADGANCSAGSYPLGVDASGAVQNCTVAAVGTVTSVTATAPLFSTGGATPNLTWFGLSTTTALTGGRLLYSNGANGVTDTATTSVTCSGSVSCSTFNVLGSSPITISGSGSGGTGLSTTSPISAGNLLVYSATGAGSAFGVATSSETCSTGVTCAAHVVLTGGGAITLSALGSAGVLGAQTATTPTVQATSTLYGNGTAGQVLGWTNGSLGFIATTSTFATLTVGQATTTGTQAIPFSATASTPVAGTIAIDSTTGQLRFSDVTGTTRVLSPQRDLGFAYATTTWGTNATTTIRIGPAPANITVNAAYCETNAGTVGVSLTDATPNRADYIRTASTTINKFNYTTNNNSFTAGESMRVDIGTPASSPTSVSCRFLYTYDQD